MLRRFLQSEAAGGLLLMCAAALALLVANSSWADTYHQLLERPVGPALTAKLGPMTPHLWINDALMAIFFLLVGLEIKREFVDGNLRSWNDRRLPILAAAAGMIVPAAVFLSLAGASPQLVSGWAIPAATDIAFAIGVLSLLGKRAPTSLKLFLTTVAIVDDLGAVAIIAMAYTAAIDTLAVGASALILLVMYFLNRSGVRYLAPYLLLGLLLWYAVLLSGVHATVAGVLTASMIPVKPTPGEPDARDSPLHKLEHGIARWVAFLIVPLFGFTNAGIPLANVGMDQLIAPLPLGIAAGLFLGKQLGIFGAVVLCVRLGIASRPLGATWLQTYAVAMLCGIGFTMSLFIGALAFPTRPDLAEEAKLGVLTGSVFSAVIGFLILRYAPPLHSKERP